VELSIHFWQNIVNAVHSLPQFEMTDSFGNSTEFCWLQFYYNTDFENKQAVASHCTLLNNIF